MDLGSEQPEKQLSKKLKARGKGDECRGVVMDQYFDSHVSDVQVIFSLAFHFQRNLKTELSALQNFTGVLWGDARERGVSQKGGG